MFERVVIIPNKDNQGRSLAREQALIEDTLLHIAGGFTVEDVRGAWKGDDGRVYRDASKRYTIIASPAQDKEIARRIPIWCLNTRQECIFTTTRAVKVQFVVAESGVHIGVGA